MRNQHAVAALIASLSFVAASCGDGSSDGATHLVPIGGEVDLFHRAVGSEMSGIYAYFSESTFLVDDQDVPMEECRTLDLVPYEEPIRLDAGASLHLTGGPASPLELAPVNGSYVLTSSELPWFAPNTAYTVAGAGGTDIGAFATALLSPGRVDLVSPIQKTLSSNEDLIVVWSSTSNSTPVFVRVQQLVFENNDIVFEYEALCQFEDDGSGVVPANIMGHLRTDDTEDHTHTTIRVEKRSAATFDVSGASGAIRTSSWQDDYATNLVD